LVSTSVLKTAVYFLSGGDNVRSIFKIFSKYWERILICKKWGRGAWQRPEGCDGLLTNESHTALQT
jgi:hypothetical protein